MNMAQSAQSLAHVCSFRLIATLIVTLMVTTAMAQAQPRFFAGAGPGVSILSGASGTAVGPDSAALSNYDPELGRLAHVFAGWHAWEYVSLQAAWSANRNAITFSSAGTGAGFYQQRRSSSQQNIGMDALLYFRDRRSVVRPFLSAGVNYMWFRSDVAELAVSAGLPQPPPSFTDQAAGLRVAAGTDLVHPNGWGFRYAFMEHLQQRNVIGSRLSPAATRQLMNFQHLFAVIRNF